MSPNGRGGMTRYGTESPHLDGAHFVGHVGLITETGLLIDPTAGEFPEIRAAGYRPLVGRIGDTQMGLALEGGARAMVRLQVGGVVTYRSDPRGSADQWVAHLLASETENLAVLINNTALGFIAAMASLGPERVTSIRAGSHRRFAARVAAFDGRRIEVGSDGVFKVVS